MSEVVSPAPGRVLVASANAETATAIVEHLSARIEHVSSITEDLSVDGFFLARPDVLVLGFDAVQDSAEYLGRIRNDGRPLPNIFRTLLLCAKEEVAVAFERCNTGEFDDYVMYWPLSYDGSRLPMSVLVALRTVTATRELTTAVAKAREAAGESAGADATADANAGLRAGPRRILVVEDNALARSVIKEALKGVPHQLMFAGDGAAALAAVSKLHPDLVFMDINLPGVDGIELTRRFKAMPGLEKLPVIMMTGDSTRETVARSMSAGAESFLVKPVTQNALLMHVHKHLPFA